MSSRKSAISVELTKMADLFQPRDFRMRVCDLRKFGIQHVPCIGQVSHARQNVSSGWHVHVDHMEFIYCVAGPCDYECAERRYRLAPGMMFVPRANEAHRQLECPKGFSFYSFLFKPTSDKVVSWLAARLARIPRLFACSRDIPARFGRIFALAGGARRGFDRRIRLQTEIQALLLDVLDSTKVKVKKDVRDVYAAIAERMKRQPEDDYPLNALVAESGVSRSTFIAKFKSSYGYAPHVYLLHCRVEAAKRLLSKGGPVHVIADCLGFSSARQFARTFCNFTGLTPTEWRKSPGNRIEVPDGISAMTDF